MDQQQLAAKLSLECKAAAEIVLNNSAEDAAQLIYERQLEASRPNSKTSKVEGSLYLLDAIVNLWSIAH